MRNISWQSYQFLVRDFESEPRLRLTYDCGILEIRMPLDPHESFKKLLGRLLEASLALPIFTAADVMRFLEQYPSIGEHRLIKQFRQWIRNH